MFFLYQPHTTLRKEGIMKLIDFYETVIKKASKLDMSVKIDFAAS